MEKLVICDLPTLEMLRDVLFKHLQQESYLHTLMPINGIDSKLAEIDIERVAAFTKHIVEIIDNINKDV